MAEEGKSVSRRRTPRMRVALKAGVMVQEEGEPKPEYRITENISTGGMLITCAEERYPIGARLRVWLDLTEETGVPASPDAQVECEVRVIHLIHPRGFGVEITAMADEDRRRYFGAIREYAEDPRRRLPDPD